MQEKQKNTKNLRERERERERTFLLWGKLCIEWKR